MKTIYRLGKLSEEEQLKLDFEDALSRTIEERIELGFILMKIPIIDDVPYRVFDTIEEYRKWMDNNLPKYLGYNIVE